MNLPAALGLGLALYIAFRAALALVSSGLRLLLSEAAASALLTPSGFTLLALALRLWLRLVGSSTEAAVTLDGVVRDALVVGAVWLAAQVVTQLSTRWYFERVRGVALPNVVRRVVAGTLYAIGALALLQARFAWSAGDVVLLTSVAALAAGVVFQSALGGMLASLSLGLSDAVRVGDLVRVGEAHGWIEEIDARNTVLRAVDGGHVVIANRRLLEASLVNFSRPARAHPVSFVIAASASAPPNAVKTCLARCVREAQGARAEPAPEVLQTGIVGGATEYRVTLYVDDWTRRSAVEDAVRTAAWYRLRREGYAWPTPPPDEVDRAEAVRFLSRVPILAPLAPEELEGLAARAAPVLYGAGETVFEQGDEGESLYVVRRGTVRLSVALPTRDGAQSEKEIAAMGAGESFGERSLLTGAKRSAHCVAVTDAALLRIDKDSLRAIVMSNPAIVERLGDIIASQDEQDRARITEHERIDASRPRAERASLLAVIRAFFR